ncbi:MAG: TfoX/Sxy family protein [Anaerolineales bacterium]|nr:TfoX/Sxy family protein [Anaerolineales bacterium]
MPYNKEIAQRIREMLEDIPEELNEKRMFGGLAFMMDGFMTCGVHRDRLIVRVGKDNYEEAMAQPHTVPFDITGRPLSGWVMVEADGITGEKELKEWVQKGIEFAESLPPK